MVLIDARLWYQISTWGATGWAVDGPRPTQNFGWVGHNAFGPTNNWPVCSLILRKISKIGTTRCQVLRLKCTKFTFHWGSVPDPAGTPLAVLNGPTSKAREGKGRGGERGREGKIKEPEGETRWREGFGPPKNFGVRPLRICMTCVPEAGARNTELICGPGNHLEFEITPGNTGNLIEFY